MTIEMTVKNQMKIIELDEKLIKLDEQMRIIQAVNHMYKQLFWNNYVNIYVFIALLCTQ